MEGGSCHVVAMPYPGRGHINPMLNLCKRLSSKRPDVHVTFVVTEEWLGLLLPAVANVHYATIPNVIPSEVGRAKDILGFLEAVRTNMEAPFEDLLDGLPSPPDVIVFDTYLEWVTGVGSRRGVPVASLWTQSATVLSLFYHFDLVKQHRHFPLHVSGAEKASLDDFCIAMPALESLVVDYCFLRSLEVRKCGSHPKWLRSLKSLEARDVHLWNMDEVTSLLGLIGSSPNLKQLLIEVNPYYDVDGMENPFSSLEANHLDFPPCKKLEVVSLQRIVDRDEGMDIVKLLLLKSPNLKTMFIETFEDATSDERLKILTKVTRFRRASVAAEIDFC